MARFANRTCIHIIDPDAAVRDGLTELLTLEGFKTVAFATAEHYLRHRCGHAAGSILLCNDYLPDTDSLQLLIECRAYDVTPILMVSRQNAASSRRALASGLNLQITKPIGHKQELLSLLRQVPTEA